MSGLLDVSVSALVAQRTRLDAIAANLASADIGDPANNSELGVHVADIREVRAFIPRYEPLNPYADADGRVWYPDINPVEQQVNMMLAARSYEANIAAIEATKSMTNSAMEILS